MSDIEKFCELLRKGNPTMTFEIESDSPYSGVKWIVYRKGDINSVNLPKGATLIDCRTVKYNEFTFHLIPYDRKGDRLSDFNRDELFIHLYFLHNIFF